MNARKRILKAIAAVMGSVVLSACYAPSGADVGMQAAGSHAVSLPANNMREGQSLAAQEVGRALNAERTARGISPVVHSAALSRAAERHARDMVDSGVFSHSGSDGSTPRSRVRASGFGACLYAENIAWGQATVTDAMRGWMASPGHRANNLRRAVTHYGAAHAGERNYWVVVFANQC